MQRKTYDETFKLVTDTLKSALRSRGIITCTPIVAASIAQWFTRG